MRIEATGLTKRFGGLTAIDGASFLLEPGRICALLGPNGAGKTTLMRIMAGVVEPSRGRIIMDDEPLTRARVDLRRRLMFLADSPVAYGHMTPVQHIGMVLRLYDALRDDLEARVAQIMKDLEILPYAMMPLATLSRGQLYKVLLTALVALDPELWLLDEPFASGMDPNGIISFKRYAREAAAAGRTVVYSTQILDAAHSFCDVACILHRGRIEAFSSIEELNDRVGNSADPLTEVFTRLKEDRPL